MGDSVAGQRILRSAGFTIIFRRSAADKKIAMERKFQTAVKKGENAFCQAENACQGCANYCKMLRQAGLRPTRQRMALAELMFSKGDRHISAEVLFDEAVQANVPVSLATIYNTLHQFSGSGLLKAISIDSSKTYFDTNTGDHHHFYVEDTEQVLDMPDDAISVANLPAPPEGMEIASVDVVVRVRSKR